ncbi:MULTISPECIES: hypothetical protein [Sutcliffiella]|uniref:Uncharacterized protein n=1 Tax=Sutcliffiella cohnii TaxID=33932 RepID=A0A223KVE6_9BACI|nr:MULTISPECIES: hypothetical protein [Sutcliffiella]AST93451.1 hypothetical protein BC6307_20360 [Sutcliffiella cohnii]WBL14620.1 hypothetical protein O1A01_22540 [Sutcliffiella sp. NC1]
MKKIKLDDHTIKNANDQLRKPLSLLGDSRVNLTQTKNRMEWKVRNRSNADGRISKVCSDIKQLESNIKRIERFVASSSQRYFEIDNFLANKALRKSGNLGNIYKSLAALGAHPILARNIALQIAKDAISDKVKLQQGKNLKFNIFKKDGKVFFQLIGKEMRSNNSRQYNDIRNTLVREFGGESGTYKRRFVERLLNGGGIPIYVTGKGAKGVITDNYNKFSNNTAVNTYINSRVDPIGNFKQSFNSSLKGGFKFWDDFNWKGVSNLQKGAKFFGAAGTALTVGDNFINTFKNSSGTGWNFSEENQKKFAVDTTIDLSVAATSFATGAAFGSFFLPPVGTVVGAGTGIVIHSLVNIKFGDPPPKSIVDHTKDFANTAANKISDIGNDLKEIRNNAVVSIGKNLTKIFF